MSEQHEFVKRKMRRIGHKVEEELPRGFGYVVLAFDFGTGDDKQMIYASNANRQDVVRAMEEFIEKTKTSYGNDTGKY